MMSDSFSHSVNDAAMMSELQRCCVAARECSGISSESKAGLSVGTSLAPAPECGLMEMYMLKAFTCTYANPYLTLFSDWLDRLQLRLFLFLFPTQTFNRKQEFHDWTVSNSTSFLFL